MRAVPVPAARRGPSPPISIIYAALPVSGLFSCGSRRAVRIHPGRAAVRDRPQKNSPRPISGTKAVASAVPPGLTPPLCGVPSSRTVMRAPLITDGVPGGRYWAVAVRAALARPFGTALTAAVPPSAALWQACSPCVLPLAHRFCFLVLLIICVSRRFVKPSGRAARREHRRQRGPRFLPRCVLRRRGGPADPSGPQGPRPERLRL